MNRVYNYNGIGITFIHGDSIMVNATEMGKSFGKRPSDWLNSQRARAFVSELSRVRSLRLTDIVRIKQGNPKLGGGTWLHEEAAMEFARWLSASFAIWCNDRLDELMTHTEREGGATVNNDDQAILHAIELLQKRIQEAQIRLNEPGAPLLRQSQKVVLDETSTTSPSSCLVGSLAKLMAQRGIPIGQNRLFKWLRDSGYLGKCGDGYNVPMQRYVDQGLFVIKQGVRNGREGALTLTQTTMVTAKGQAYFMNKFLKEHGANNPDATVD